MARTKGAVRNVDNRKVRAFLMGYKVESDFGDEFFGIDTKGGIQLDLEPWAMDCIYGGKQQVQGDRKIDTHKIFMGLYCLNDINTETVGRHINRLQMVFEGKHYSKRMVEYYAAAFKCASSALLHQLEKRGIEVEIPPHLEYIDSTPVDVVEGLVCPDLQAVAETDLKPKGHKYTNKPTDTHYWSVETGKWEPHFDSSSLNQKVEEWCWDWENISQTKVEEFGSIDAIYRTDDWAESQESNTDFEDFAYRMAEKRKAKQEVKPLVFMIPSHSDNETPY